MPSLTDYASAIASIESAGSGGYGALGPPTKGDRAYGRYQVMGSNIPDWTKAALGRSLTPQEFLADPAVQDAVFNHRFGGYLDKYGNPQDAASAWFTGRPLAAGAGASDVLGTTGQGYVDRFNAALGGGPTASGSPSGAAPVQAGLFAGLGAQPTDSTAATDASGLFAKLAAAQLEQAQPQQQGLLQPMGFLPMRRRMRG